MGVLFLRSLSIKSQFHEAVLSAGHIGRSDALMCVVVIIFLDLFGRIAMYTFSHVVSVLAVGVVRTVCSWPAFCRKA